MISINGFPKSGNFLLMKACELLGVEPSPVCHTPYSAGVTGQNIFIKRDPRNIVISMMTFMDIPVTPANFMQMATTIPDTWFTTPASLVDNMALFEGWLTDPNTYVTSFEALLKDDTEIQNIAKYLGVTYAGNWASLEGLTRTWQTPHSDYTTIWNADLDTFWSNLGGNQLLATWGYGTSNL